MNIIWKGSPNFWEGRQKMKPEAIVIHIMDGSLIGTDSWFFHGSAAEGKPVSAHYGVGKSGEVHQYVKEENTAWHAGGVDNPSWALIRSGLNPNLYTIGIEHEGGPTDAWTEAMKKSSAELIKEISKRWNIPIDRDHIIGHYQIFSKKPNCPAQNKGIIDELISLARLEAQIGMPGQVQEGIKKIEEGINQIKKSYGSS